MGISVKQFEQLKGRLTQARRKSNTAVDRTPPAKQRSTLTIIGIDPSLRATGFGLIRKTPSRVRALAHGTISCAGKWEHSRCLLYIYETLRDVIKLHKPSVCAVEGLFFAQNLKTALIMGEARGSAMVAAAESGLEIYEIAPRRMKQAIVGFGGAQKHAVAKMVQRMLDLDTPPGPDAADALALALTFTLEQRNRIRPPSKKI